MATLSSITVTQILDELKSNDDFSKLAQAKQIELINSAIQEVATLYIADERHQYKANTGITLVPSFFAGGYAAGTETLAEGDNPVTFNQALQNDQYDLRFSATLNGEAVGVDISNISETGFTVNSPQADVIFKYSAIPFN